ncbi:hypothetical protein CDAR_58521 [Caerostris darwini]|uniref:Uncharacterized protein n=1 Tax=Caerostris darwini TaxID=1538125 RepID=A0AAV4U741_9ARAC|nr:hypothetical protein CDAR_58521 [Caerostris darwini]
MKKNPKTYTKGLIPEYHFINIRLMDRSHSIISCDVCTTAIVGRDYSKQVRRTIARLMHSPLAIRGLRNRGGRRTVFEAGVVEDTSATLPLAARKHKQWTPRC